jgi:3-methyladenine DNA glycosylase AlkD
MNLSQTLSSITQTLVAKSDAKAKAAFQKFIPTSQNVYGVRVPLLNELARKHKEGGFQLVQALWKSGAFEERLLAAKILGRICKQDPKLALKLTKRFASEITDWAVCDTLGMQGVKGIASQETATIFGLSKSLIKSNNFWERRLAIVLLTHFAKDRSLRQAIEAIVNQVRQDKEHYVTKAVQWIERDLRK